jgi:glycosyltransferase involved in cell wall biosynthesis
LVSVIITTRNEEKNILACLKSIKAQSYSPIEIIVVDNKSNDRTKEISKTFTEMVYDHGPERSWQRNFGVSKANGEFVIYIDADMILTENVIKECVDTLTNNPELVALHIPEKIVGEGYWIKVRDFEGSFYRGTVIEAVRFMRRTVFLQLGGFDTSLCGPEDWDLDKRVRSVGSVSAITSLILHNEHRIEVKNYLKKKSYYAQTMDGYVKKWGRDDKDLRKQLGAFYRFFWVYVGDGKYLKVLRHPFLTVSMFYLRFRVGLAFLFRGNQ